MVTGSGAAEEHALPGTEDVCTGLGLAAAIDQAAPRPATPAERFDSVLCDLNGETYRTEEWGFALLRRQDWFVDPHAYVAPVNNLGDVGAASGPLLVGLAAVAGLKEYAPGPRAFVWCSSDGVERATLALQIGKLEKPGHDQCRGQSTEDADHRRQSRRLRRHDAKRL